MPPRRPISRTRSLSFVESKQLIDDLSSNYIQDLDGTLCVQETEVRQKSEQAPMGAYKRRKLYWCSFFKKQKNKEVPPSLDENENPNNESTRYSRRQYYVPNLNGRKKTMRDWLLNTLDTNQVEYNIGNIYCDYVNWTYTARPILLFLSFLIFFMIQLFIFSILILVAGNMRPSCITTSGESFSESNAPLADAFSLSWSTFTTVGYGMVYPATSIERFDQESCTGVIFLLTMESLIGLLYAGMCTALLFGKVVRIQSHAQVQFSNALCVRYNVQGMTDLTNESHMNISGGQHLDSTKETEKELPQTPKSNNHFPILSFQIVNQKANQRKGGIMDASIKAIALHTSIDEKTRKYTRVEMVEGEHPFFKQVWIGNHVLNQFSTLLTSTARSTIIKNGGNWPAEWNNPNAIRQILNFDELTVTLSGVSNVTACTVYNYKTYKYLDLIVGYEFAPLLYKGEGTDSYPKVDMSLINDVVVQHGLENELMNDDSKQRDLNTSEDFDNFIDLRSSGRT